MCLAILLKIKHDHDMLFEIKYKIGKWIKRKVGIRSWKRLRVTAKRKIERLFYKRSYSTQEIIALMKSMGLKKGATVFVHSSWSEFYNYIGSINEFIDAILAEIGSDGTLAMPAYPDYSLITKPDSIFYINSTPTVAGKIAETFRNYPDVKRSVNRHSVCALGYMSSYLIDEHQFSTTCWDDKSPYYKLAELDALIFSFGLGKYFIGTAIHCASSILKDEVPYFARFFDKKTILKIELEDKTIYSKESYDSQDGFFRYITKGSRRNFIKHLDKSQYTRKKISNLSVNVYNARYLINESISLGRRGIVTYKRPNPSKELFAK